MVLFYLYKSQSQYYRFYYTNNIVYKLDLISNLGMDYQGLNNKKKKIKNSKRLKLHQHDDI